jgi:putative endonuclease
MSRPTQAALGKLGERLAEEHLTESGFQIVERNFRTRYGELDLVAADPDCLVFCEVKTRSAHTWRGPPGPLDAIGPGKRRQLRLMAREWLASSNTGAGRPHPPGMRFDAIGITLGSNGELVTLEHVESAF